MASRLLLDTCALLWWFGNPGKLSAAARQAIEESDLLVSAVSGYEIALKINLGKLELSMDLGELLVAVKAYPGMRPLPVTMEHAAMAGALPFTHKDPFDRIIVAQAKVEGVKIVTSDAVFEEYGVGVVW
ncbi:type II toxin-antitoxin system VapC family toxin [Desulfocurvibacter africanus]|uniref:type II toxin-antitoxin system VapC family toxin n=1 Tax=Desulfocurvibacter africanus TaxID=873 RepID=UPI000414CA2C|nr:type II toxin-antitoxin system VapC family toxin [Desulfocurvibacter africanus]